MRLIQKTGPGGTGSQVHGHDRRQRLDGVAALTALAVLLAVALLLMLPVG